ncbi:MAG: hypothetical protein IT206_05500 [Fimbriimonadaceae bacterium]|nr:hypothetical protein [Fimbriimonadaceae bacterium]
MEVKLLGTGAADGVPAFFANSRVSDHAFMHGGKDIRTRAAAVIDGHIKLDFGPDTYFQVVSHQTRPAEWSSILFTHSHDDHLCEAELQYVLMPFTQEGYAPFTIFGNESVLARIQARFQDWPFELVLTKSFETFEHLGYHITPIAAYHRLEEDCHNLIIEHEGRSFLYGTDTGYWREPTWEFMAGRQLHAVVLECTDGFLRTSYHGHMDAQEVIQTVNRLVSIGGLRADGQVITTHHCHAGNATHEELEAFLKPHGIQVGFDGLSFEV